jgi:hypothetical protein
VFDFEVWSTVAGWMWAAAFLLAMLIHLFVGFLKTAHAALRMNCGALSERQQAFDSTVRHTVSTFAPLAVWGLCQSAGVGDLVFLWRHRPQLDAAIAGDVLPAATFYDVTRDGPCTVICVSGHGITDCYWLIHDPSESLDRERFAASFSWDSGVFRRVHHVCGPWYSLID